MIRTSCKHYKKCDNGTFLCYRFMNERFQKNAERLSRCHRNCFYYENAKHGSGITEFEYNTRIDKISKDEKQTKIDTW